jgi:two component transcriptional regulator, araC family
MKEKIDQKFQVFSQPGMRQEHMEKREFLTPLLLDGFGGELPEEEHRILMKEAISCGLLDGEEPEALNYAVMVTRILDKDGKNCTTRGSVKAIDSILKKYTKYCSVYLQGRVVSLLLATPRGFDKYLHILVDDICQSVERIMGMDSVIGVSRVVEKLERCHECYLEAMSAAANYGKEEGNIHFISDDERTESFDKVMVHQTVEDIENLLRKGRPEEISGYLQNFFDQVVQHKISQSETDFILMLIVSTVYQVLYSVAGEEVVQQMQQKFPMYSMKMFGNIGDSRQFYVDICTTARLMIADQRKKSSVMLCNRAIRIINEKFADPDLSLVSVSTEISVSPNYLSALLKKDTGETFKELLTKKRIETAKELLMDTNMKVREISEKCGYNDQHYFSYCFKKYTGVSPNSCRRTYEDGRQD